MEKIFLLLRQRKLLYILQHRTGVITGAELAKQLGATSRTVRSDVATINRSLAPYHIRISSVRGKGYRLEAGDSALVRQLLQAETAFLTKEDRLRYLAFQLCLTDGEISTDELEDEMFISHGTLENDLQNLAEKYMRAGPRIEIFLRGGFVSFAHDERKRRRILSELYYEHWNYNERSNAFYDYDFLDEARLAEIINLVMPILHRNAIRMEDSNLVNLNLTSAIMLERIASGHALPPAPEIPRDDAQAAQAAAELSDALEARFGQTLSQQERDELFLLIHAGKLLDCTGMDCRTARDRFGPLITDMADAYLASVRECFGLDFTGDTDFYITLLQMIHYLQSPERILNSVENPELVKRMLLTEMELAWPFQRVSRRYTGKYLTGLECLTLAEFVSGALEYQYHHHPGVKIRTVICCHLPMPVAWAVMRKIRGRFGSALEILDILPVNAKSAFDFSTVDLILATVHKPIAGSFDCDVIEISPQVTPEEIQAIEAYVKLRQLRKIFTAPPRGLEPLFSAALWQEDMEFREIAQAAAFCAEALIGRGIAGAEFAEDIRHRLELEFHAVEPGILFLPSSEPAAETRLSIVLLKHRVMLKKCKIRAVVTGAFRAEERALIPHLAGFFHRKNLSVKSFGEIRTREDFLRLFSDDTRDMASAERKDHPSAL